MASPSSSSSSSVRALDNLYQILPQGHEKALKHAFYNTAAILFVAFAGAGAVALYYILEAFIRPLLWAVLCGTFLYPFKRSLTNGLRRWLNGLRSSGTPLVVGFALTPVVVLDRASDGLGNAIIQNIQIVFGMCAGIPVLYCTYHFAPLMKILYGIQVFLYYVDVISSYFSSLWVWTIFIAYLLVLIFYWSPDNTSHLRLLAIIVWVVLALHIAAVAGVLRVPLLLFMCGLTVTGLVIEARDTGGSDHDEIEEDGSLGITDRMQNTYIRWLKKPQSAEDVCETAEKSIPPADTKPTKPDKLVLGTKKPSLSNRYFLLLFWAFVFVHSWSNMALLYIALPVPFAIFLVKNLVRNVISGAMFGNRINRACTDVKGWVKARERLLIPRYVMSLYQKVMKGDGKLITILEQSLDAATSTLLILLLLVGVILLAIFSVVQIQRESVHLITVTSNVVNSSLHHPAMIKWVPKSEDMGEAIDSMVQNAYVYGRDWLASKVGDMVHGARGGDGAANKSVVEKQIVDVWDQLYHTWFAKNTSTHVHKPGFHMSSDISGISGISLSGIWDMVSKTDTSVLTKAVDFVKENIDTFTSVLESVWTVLKGNLNLVFSVATTILSVVFGGGTAILNFLLSAVIFLTTLFYLLASSGEQYKPMQWFGNIGGSQGGTGNKFGHAVEAAISGVFTASLKMAGFYGLYTWLTHTIFSINIVFIPSALAATFAAIPFVGPYWAAIPAVLELWLVHGEWSQALTLLICHLLPSSLVDTAIYSEIQGGHPFMTGLAITGGMVCLGLEGAVIGPIVLCCLIVAVNVYGTMLKPDSGANTPSIDTALSKRVHWDSRPVQSMQGETDVKQ